MQAHKIRVCVVYMLLAAASAMYLPVARRVPPFSATPSHAAHHFVRMATSDAVVTTPLLGPGKCECLTWILERHSELPVPRMRWGTEGGPASDDAYRCCLDASSRVLGLEQPFTLYWDLRRLSVPNPRQLKLGFDWVAANQAGLETYVQGIVFIVPNPIVRACVNLVLKTLNPSQPIRICKGEDAALEFLREHGGDAAEAWAHAETGAESL